MFVSSLFRFNHQLIWLLLLPLLLCFLDKIVYKSFIITEIVFLAAKTFAINYVRSKLPETSLIVFLDSCVDLTTSSSTTSFHVGERLKNLLVQLRDLPDFIHHERMVDIERVFRVWFAALLRPIFCVDFFRFWIILLSNVISFGQVEGRNQISEVLIFKVKSPDVFEMRVV